MRRIPIIVALLLALLPRFAEATAGPVQTFFVVLPEATAEVSREAFETCGDRFAASLVSTAAFRANQDAETQRSVSECLGTTASATAQRACEVSMANVQVDYLIRMVARRIGSDWSWSLKALEPSSGAAQIWGSDHKPAGLADPVEAAYLACDKLGRAFACAQGVATACEGAALGSGPILVEGGGGQRPADLGPAAVTVSALDVIRPVPAVVSVWIDGREVGTSSRQITGITPGSHEVALKATGYQPYVERLTFEAGKPTKLRNIELLSTTSRLLIELDDPQTATVRIDGREVGTTGEPIAGIEPGLHAVVLRADGYEDFSGQLSFEAGRQTERSGIRMTALPATLELTTSVMGAEVRIDGRTVGQSQGPGLVQRLRVPSGEHTVTIAAEDYLEVSRRVALAPGGSLRLDLALERDDPGARAARERAAAESAARAEAETAATLTASTGENCSNGIDDDRDGYTDCADSLCAGASGCGRGDDNEDASVILRAHGSLLSMLDFVEDIDAKPSYGDMGGEMEVIGGAIGWLDEPGGVELRVDYQQMTATKSDLDITSGYSCTAGSGSATPPCEGFDSFTAQSLSYLVVSHDSEPLTLGVGGGLFGHTIGETDYALGYSYTLLMELLPLDADFAKAGVALRLDFSPSSGGNMFTLLSLQWSGGFDF